VTEKDLPRTVVLAAVAGRIPEVDPAVFSLLPRGSEVVILEASDFQGNAFAAFERLAKGVKTRRVHSGSRFPTLSETETLLKKAGNPIAILIFPPGFEPLLADYQRAWPQGFAAASPGLPEAAWILSRMLVSAGRASALRDEVRDEALLVVRPPRDEKGLAQVFVPAGAEENFVEHTLALAMASEEAMGGSA